MQCVFLATYNGFKRISSEKINFKNYVGALQYTDFPPFFSYLFRFSKITEKANECYEHNWS